MKKPFSYRIATLSKLIIDNNNKRKNLIEKFGSYHNHFFKQTTIKKSKFKIQQSNNKQIK